MIPLFELEPGHAPGVARSTSLRRLEARPRVRVRAASWRHWPLLGYGAPRAGASGYLREVAADGGAGAPRPRVRVRGDTPHHRQGRRRGAAPACGCERRQVRADLLAAGRREAGHDHLVGLDGDEELPERAPLYGAGSRSGSAKTYSPLPDGGW